MAFDFPATPTTGQIYQPAGGPFWQYDGEKWKGGAIAGPQKEQFFDVSGKSSQDVAVPTWAKIARITASILSTTTNASVQLRISGDGTTFAGTVSDYNSAGPFHNAGTPTYSTVVPVNAGAIQLSVPVDNLNIPHTVSAQISLQRPTTADVFGYRVHSSNYHSVGANHTGWYNGYVNTSATTSLTVKALRFLFPVAKGSSYINVEWLGDDAQMPTQNAIPDAPSDGGEYVRVNGVWRQRSLYKEGLTQYDFTPPDYAKRGRATLQSLCSVPSSMGMRVSVDGTNYFAGANDYTYGGLTSYTGSLGAASQQPLINASLMQLTLVTDNVSVPQNAVVDFVVRKGSTVAVTYISRGTGYSNGAQYLYTDFFFRGYSGNATITGATALKGIRFFVPTAESQCNVEWFG